VFDAPFLLGSTLDGRCEDDRGAAVDVRWLLNLSRQEMVIAAEQASTSSGAAAKKKKTKGGANKPKQGGGNPFAALMQ
jgi:hypothetical protein